MRVVLISTDYPPLRTSAAIQMQDIAFEFALQGHEPYVFVPTNELETNLVKEVKDGVTIVRFSISMTKDSSYFRRTLLELSLPFKMIRYLRKSTYWNMQFDLVVWYSPTIFFSPLIYALKRKHKCQAYLILRDIFPEWARDLGLITSGPVYLFFKMVANIQYALADTIGVQTSSNLVYLNKWGTNSKRKVEVLHNWQRILPNVGSSIIVNNTILEGRKLFLYIGNMGIAQGIDSMIELAENLSHRADLGFLFVGRGSEVIRLKTYVKEHKLTNTLFLDEVDSKEMHGLLAQCHIGLVALDTRHKTHNIPGKFLTYLFYGLPVLGKVNSGTDLIQLIVSEKVGKAYAGNSPLEFSRIAEEMIDSADELERMAERGKILGKRLFSPSSKVKQIISSI